MMDWSNNLPPWTSQYSVANRVDAMDCLSESFINIFYMLTGFDSSPRALAKLAPTTPNGSAEFNVVGAAEKYGLVPYYLWPSPNDFDWETYYAPVPQSVLNKSAMIKVKQVAPDLNISPLWTILRFPSGIQHGVAQLNQTQYFDSEQGSPVKPLNYGGATIISQTSLIFTPMTNAKLVKNGNEWGFYLPATNEAAMIDKAANVAYPLPTKNNGANVDWSQIKPDLNVTPVS